MAKTFEALEKSKHIAYSKKKKVSFDFLNLPAEVRHQIEILKSQIICRSHKVKIQTILFSSYRHGEGTTTIVNCFAQSLAQDRKYKVLLIDANTRSPGLCSLNSKANQHESTVFQDLYNDGFRHLETLKFDFNSNLFFIPCGQISRHPSDIFHQRQFADFLKIAQKNFDYIVFDSSPVGKYYDSILLAPSMDCVILITQAEKTNEFELLRVKNLFKERNIPITGVILNRRKFRIPASIFNRFFK